MKDILDLIQQKQASYAQLPFFQFMRNSSIPPKERLAFAPCAAYFIMSFADLNKYILRQEPTEDKIQAILNQHTYEDDFHWQWFLEDMQKLGFDIPVTFNDSLKFLWSEETKISRLLSFQLYQYIAQSQPLEKLVILEAIEATADIFLSLTKQITDELQVNTDNEYRYFGSCHLNFEEEHQANSTETNLFIENIYMSPETKEKSSELVEKVFAIFTQWTEALLSYAHNANSIDTRERSKQVA